MLPAFNRPNNTAAQVLSSTGQRYAPEGLGRIVHTTTLCHHACSPLPQPSFPTRAPLHRHTRGMVRHTWMVEDTSLIVGALAKGDELLAAGLASRGVSSRQQRTASAVLAGQVIVSGVSGHSWCATATCPKAAGASTVTRQQQACVCPDAVLHRPCDPAATSCKHLQCEKTSLASHQPCILACSTPRTRGMAQGQLRPVTSLMMHAGKQLP